MSRPTPRPTRNPHRRPPRPPVLAAAILAASTLLGAPSGRAEDARAGDARVGDGRAGDARVGDGRGAAVRILVTSRAYDFYAPWQSNGSRSDEMTGCVLPGRRILTVAYPLRNHTMVQVTKRGQSRRTPAEVVLKDYASNLAILEVRDPAFFADLTEVQPERPGWHDGRCTIIGWDRSGMPREYAAERLSTDVNPYYSHGVAVRHRMATDLDRGGYGEPVLRGGRLVGIADGIDREEKSVDVIGIDSIRRLLDDLADSRYEGQPFFTLEAAPVGGDENLRGHLGLVDGESGLYVSGVPAVLGGEGGLQPGDVLLQVGGRPIDDEGMYDSPEYGKLDYRALVGLQYRVGGELPLRVLRQGRRLTVRVTLPPIREELFLVNPLPTDRPPLYLVWGGLLFTELTYDYLETWGDGWKGKADERLVWYWNRALYPSGDRRRVVLLVQVFAMEENTGYHSIRNAVLRACDGRTVRDLAHLRELLAAGGGPEGGSPYRSLSFEDGRSIVLERAAVEAAGKKVVETYGVRRLTNLP